jgi:hypothetical protein
MYINGQRIGMTQAITQRAKAKILSGRLPGNIASCAGVLGTAIHGTSAFRAVAGTYQAAVTTFTAAGVVGNYLDFLCFSLEWGKREGGEALVARQEAATVFDGGS